MFVAATVMVMMVLLFVAVPLMVMMVLLFVAAPLVVMTVFLSMAAPFVVMMVLLFVAAPLVVMVVLLSVGQPLVIVVMGVLLFLLGQALRLHLSQLVCQRLSVLHGLHQLCAGELIPGVVTMVATALCSAEAPPPHPASPG